MRDGICEKCADKGCFGYDHRITECEDFKAETKADKIRAMTDEELADYLEAVSEDSYNAERPLTSAEFLEWLKQEATDDAD